MADRIQLDGKTFIPLIEAAGMTAISEKQVMALAQSGQVFLRAIGKKVYVDIDGLRNAVRTQQSAPVVEATVAPLPVAPLVKARALSAPPAAPISASVDVPMTPQSPTVLVWPAPKVLETLRVATPPLPTPHIPVQSSMTEQAPMRPASLVAAPLASTQVRPENISPHHLSSAELSALAPIEISAPAVRSTESLPLQAPSRSNSLPRMVLPPKQLAGGTGRSFATSASTLVALVFVIGGGVAVYENKPALARFVGHVGEQVAAAVSFGNTATYQAQPGTLGNSPLENSPSELQASTQAGTIPVAVASSSQPIYYVYNYPVIERIRTEVQYIDAESPQDFAQQLDALYQRIQAQIQSLNISTNTNFAQQYQVIAQTNNIDKLGSVTIDNNSTFSGGTVTGSTLTDIASLAVSGGTTLGGLTVGDITASGGGTFSGAGIFSYLTASSTSATSTFNGALLATRAPTIPHTFSSWTTGAANSGAFDAALVINPSSAVADSNLFSAMVNGSVKFLVDVEGDVFVNNLTSVGSVTLSTTSASTFTVEGNTTLGDSITDTTTINGALVVSGTTTVSTVSGKFGVGTTTPWAKLAVQATAGQSHPIFEIASSSSGTSYLTVASSGNVGIGTTSPSATLAVTGTFTTTGTNTFGGALNIAGAITSTASTANTFPYASSTALTVSGTGYFAAASTTNLTVSALTSGRVPFITTAGAFTDSSAFAFDSSLTRLTVTNASTTALTVNGSAYFNVASTSQLSVFSRAYFGGSATSTFDSAGNIFAVGTLGVGTSSPLRKFAVEQAASAAQFSVAYDTTRVTEIQTDSSGDVVINPSGDDARLNDDNLWVCAGGSCPSGTPSDTGNLIVETKIGIGSSTPMDLLSISGTPNPRVRFNDSGGSAFQLLFDNSDAYLDNAKVGKNFVFRTSNSSALDTTAITILSSGKTGIGTTTPTDMLSVHGLLRVGANSVAPVTLGTATSTFNGDIKILGKLDVGTIDPAYTIGGTKYATYGHSTVGIKEETVLKISMQQWDPESGLYRYIIDFDELERGIDLWLFYQITDFGKDWKNLIVSLTPAFNGFAFYEEDIEKNAIIIYSSQEGQVSARLIANRFDFSKWTNLRPDQDGDSKGTHVIEEKR